MSPTSKDTHPASSHLSRRRLMAGAAGAALLFPIAKAAASVQAHASTAPRLVLHNAFPSSSADLILVGPGGEALLEDADYPWGRWCADCYRLADQGSAAPTGADSTARGNTKHLVVMAGDLGNPAYQPFIAAVVCDARERGHVLLSVPTVAHAQELPSLEEDLTGPTQALARGAAFDLFADETLEPEHQALLLALDLDGVRIAIEQLGGAAIADKILATPGHYTILRSRHSWETNEAPSDIEGLLAHHLQQVPHEGLSPTLLSIGLSAAISPQIENQIRRRFAVALAPAQSLIAISRNTDIVPGELALTMSSLCPVG